MRLVLALAGGLAVSVGSTARADDDDAKAWQDTRAIITTRTAVKLTLDNGDEIEIAFPVVKSIRAKGDQVTVEALTGQIGTIDKSKLASQREAVELFSDRIKKGRDDPDGYFRRALACEGARDHEGALKDFGQAIFLDPKEADYHIGRGLTRLAMGESAKADADFDEAVRIDPKNPVARFARGRTLMARNMVRKAVADYTEAIRFMPTCVSAYVERGICRELKQDWDGAMKDYAEAIHYSPTNDKALTRRGTLFYQRKEYAEAVKEFTAAAKANPKNLMALNNQAWILATCPDDKLRDGKKALALSKSAGELDGWKHPGFLGTYAAANAEVGQFDKAVEWQEKAVALLPPAQQPPFRATLDLYRSQKPKRD